MDQFHLYQAEGLGLGPVGRHVLIQVIIILLVTE